MSNDLIFKPESVNMVSGCCSFVVAASCSSSKSHFEATPVLTINEFQISSYWEGNQEETECSWGPGSFECLLVSQTLSHPYPKQTIWNLVDRLPVGTVDKTLCRFPRGASCCNEFQGRNGWFCRPTDWNPCLTLQKRIWNAPRGWTRVAKQLLWPLGGVAHIFSHCCLLLRSYPDPSFMLMSARVGGGACHRGEGLTGDLSNHEPFEKAVAKNNNKVIGESFLAISHVPCNVDFVSKTF